METQGSESKQTARSVKGRKFENPGVYIVGISDAAADKLASALVKALAQSVAPAEGSNTDDISIEYVEGIEQENEELKAEIARLTKGDRKKLNRNQPAQSKTDDKKGLKDQLLDAVLGQKESE